MRKPAKLPEEQLKPYEWEPPGGFRTQWGDGPEEEASKDAKAPISWRELYGNDHPIELEVGFGKGLFLVNEATQRPDVNFFGIEIIRKYQRYASNRVTRRELKNCRTCWGDAKKILRDFVPERSLSVVHVFFPDPWWKSRHKKRTLFTAEFADVVLKSLQLHGILHFVTDVKEYFDMVCGIMTDNKAYRQIETPIESAPTHDMDYLTNFERKFRKEGRPIYRARWSKVEDC